MTASAWHDLVARQQGFINFTPELHAALAEVRVGIIGAGGNGAVLDLLVRLCRRYEGFRAKLLTLDGTDVGEETIILVNGRNISHLNGVATPLADSDTVSIFPVVAGG